jgi:hypothetical protein
MYSIIFVILFLCHKLMFNTFSKSNYLNFVILVVELSCILRFFFCKLEYFNYDNVKPQKIVFQINITMRLKHDFLYEPKH